MSPDSLSGADPAAPGAIVGRQIAWPTESQLSRVERAASRFNVSEAARVVSGLIRTLGEPRASIGAAAGSPSEVRITIAWELCWYQWGVDLADERGPVSSIAKGGELAELDGSAQQWNATVGEDGRLALAPAVAARSRNGEWGG